MNVRQRASAWIGALICAFLGACTVGPDYKAPVVATPPSFIAVGDFESTAPLLRWWQVLGDDNLTALIEHAIGGANLDLRSADARIRQARAERGVASAQAEPTVSASAQVSRDRYSRNSELFANVPFSNPQVQFTDYRAGFDASWELDLFGHIRRNVEGADARLQGSQASWQDTRVSIAGEVARTYIQLRQGERELSLGEADLAALEQSAELVQLRWAAGNASAIELGRARADARAQSAAIDQIRTQTAAALNALAVLEGATPEAARAMVQPARPVPAIGAGKIAVGLPSELLRRRPDVRHAERELAAATADIGVATADLYPRFELAGNFGVDTIQPGQLGKLASRTWSLAPQFYLPLFGRDRLTSEVSAREAARDAALSAYQKAVLAALSDVETAMVRFDRGRARLTELEQAAGQLEAIAALVREQREAGRSSSIDVLQAEHQARQLQEQVSDARADLAVALVALYKALAGGWDETDPVDSAVRLDEHAQRTSMSATEPLATPMNASPGPGAPAQ